MGKDAKGSGGWVKLTDDMPVRVTILEYLGTTESKKFEGKIQYLFAVSQEGSPAKLTCNWKLMKALQEQAELLDSPFAVTITQKKIIAEVEINGTKQKKLVNDYTLADVKPVGDEVPF